MTDSEQASPAEIQSPKDDQTNAKAESKAPTPARCFSGSAIAGVLAFALYSLTSAIATTFAHTPVSTKNMFAIKIAIAVRTLVVGVSALGTGIFTLVTVGLIALGIQLFWQGSTSPSKNSN